MRPTTSTAPRRLGLAALLAILPLGILPLTGCSREPSLENADLSQVWRLANRGVGLIEQGEHVEAAETWKELLTIAPNWGTARINHGIAMLNAPEGEQRAMELFRGILEDDPDNPWANYCLGVLELRAGEPESAETRFRSVIETDPDDPDGHYRLAGSLQDQDRFEEAIAAYEHSLSLEPRNQSAWYELGQARALTGDVEGQQAALAEFQDLRDSGRGFERKIVYGKMGFYANAIREFDIAEPENAYEIVPAAPSFTNGSAEAGLAETSHGGRGRHRFADRFSGKGDGGDAEGISGGVGVADLDQDGDFDVVQANFGEGPEAFLWIHDAGRFEERAEELGLGSESARTIAVAAADFDGDSIPELFLGRAGQDRMVGKARDDYTGAYTVEIDGVAQSADETYAVAVADIDQDGDLDLFLGQESGVRFLRWEGEGFADVTEGTGVELTGPVLSVLAADVDGDGDVDLTAGTPEPVVLVNDRQWGFETAGLPGANNAPVSSFALGDVNGDGLTDWVLSSPVAPTQLLRADLEEGFVREPGFQGAAAKARSFGSTLFDVDRDGDLDCLGIGANATLLINDGAGEWRERSAEAGLDALEGLQHARGHAPIDFGGDGDLDLFVSRVGTSPLLVKNETETGTGTDWVAILPQGVLDGAAARGKSLGLGSRVEITTGAEKRVAYAGLGGGFGGISPQVVYFTMPGHGRFDLRINWADGVLQPELDWAGGQVHVVEQHNRETSSCPLVFFWNGERFEYLTDTLGVGGVGFFVEPELYGPPDPEEVVRIGERLAPRDGKLEVRVAEPMEEVVYLDEASLIGVAHPEGTEVHVDERFATGGPRETGRPLLVETAKRVFPSVAVSRALGTADDDLYVARADSPRDDRASLLEVDRDYAAPFAVHRRLLGYAAPWATELTFDATALGDGDEPVFLFVHGNVEYPYSRLNYAAWQGELRMSSWTLSAPVAAASGTVEAGFEGGLDGNVEWKELVRELGYPAGKPRRMAFDLTPWLDDLRVGGELKLRLSSNLVVRLDQAYLARDLSAAALASGEMRVLERHPDGAELAFTGFPREFSPDGGKPLEFDYQNRDRTSPFKALAGTYTEFGDVRGLVTERDDRFAIYGRGEEVRLTFAVEAFADVVAAPRTTWLLRARGYCKDMCPHTAEPTSIEPLPYAAMENYPPAEPLGLAHPSRMSSRNTRREPPRPPVR